MNWQDEVQRELKSAKDALASGNSGRARTCARRAVGFAIEAWKERHGDVTRTQDTMANLRQLMSDVQIPVEVRSAAERLQSRVNERFESASIDPIGDATIIITHLFYTTNA